MLLFLLTACNGGAGVETIGGDDSASLGVAEFSSDALVWTGLTPGYSSKKTLDVTNVGSGPLDVTEATIVEDPSGVFTVDFTAFSIEPGDIGSVVVSALLVEEGPAEGQLRVRTSDPAASAPLFALTVN